MKTLKKIIGLTMAMVMMAMSFAAYAETTEEHVHDGCCGESVQTTTNEGIMPLAVQYCPMCGSALQYHQISTESHTENVNCTHGAAGYDTYRVTTVYYQYDCPACIYNTGTKTSTTKSLQYCPKN